MGFASWVRKTIAVLPTCSLVGLVAEYRGLDREPINGKSRPYTTTAIVVCLIRLREEVVWRTYTDPIAFLLPSCTLISVRHNHYVPCRLVFTGVERPNSIVLHELIRLESNLLVICKFQEIMNSTSRARIHSFIRPLPRSCEDIHRHHRRRGGGQSILANWIAKGRKGKMSTRVFLAWLVPFLR
jgi:hypothetical protein